MGQVLHGCATTTEAVRRAIQHSQESLRALAKRYGINQKTVAKWKKRGSVADLPTGPKDAASTVLSVEEEAVIVAFRRHTLLPLDDCLYALQPTIPHLTRSSLHRCLQRHGISRLPQVEGEASERRKFKAYPIGYFHIDMAEVRTAEGKLYLLVAIDRTSKFAFVELHEKVVRKTAGDFLRRLIAAVPYKVHTVLTDNGTHFTTPGNTSSAAPDIRAALDAGEPIWAHAFEYACAQNHIDHRLTKPKHPWTNGQVERMNRTIKDATVKRYFYDTHDQLRAHLRDFVNAYNFARRLKTLRGLTPYEFICKAWTSQPERFNSDPLHQSPGLNIWSLLECGQAERDVHRVRQPPRKHRARRPVDDRHQIEKAAPDRNVRDVGRPDVVRALDRQIAQEIGIDPVARHGFARSRLRPERGDPHQAHQSLHALAIHGRAFGAQHCRHSARTEKGPRREQFVDPAHQRAVVVIGRLARPIDARARHAQKRALPPNRQRLVGAVEHRSAIRSAHLPDLLAKKSRSTVSCPILACNRSISRSCVVSASRPTPGSNARAA